MVLKELGTIGSTTSRGGGVGRPDEDLTGYLGVGCGRPSSDTRWEPTHRKCGRTGFQTGAPIRVREKELS